MNVRKVSSILLLLLPAICCHDAVGQAAEPGTLMITADTPVVETKPRSAGRNFMRLPSLVYTFELEAHCATGLLPRMMSLSIADTRTSLASDDISTETVTVATLEIPAAQIAPVAVDKFCIGDTGPQESDQTSGKRADERESLRISSVLSVQASLLCASETDSQMTYSSKSLDVTLSCNDPQAPRATVSY